MSAAQAQSSECDHPEAARQAYQNSFVAKVQRFMVNNAEVFNNLTKCVPSDLSSKPHPPLSSLYGDPLPLEYIIGVPINLRQQRLPRLLSAGDIVKGHMILKTPLALGVQITSLVASHKVRDMSGLDVRGLVRFENLASDRSKCEAVLKEMEVDDVIQAVVVSRRDGHFSISFSSEHVSKLCPSGVLPEGVRLGYLEGERAAAPRKSAASASVFLNELEASPGFTNPCSSDNLKAVLGVAGYDSETKPSLINSVQMANYPEAEHCHALRKAQRRKWSLDTVGIGVKHFKKGELGQAKKLFDHSLDIDPTNVEGLVARGALLANAERYREAIVEFETALTINHTHKNARKYLVETQVAYGEELEKEGKLERAVLCYQEALADDPSQDVVKTRLEALRRALERKAAEKLERERKEAAETARLKKLHSLINEEKEKKKTKAKKKKRKSSDVRKKKKRRPKKKSRHKHRDESDTSDSEDSCSDSSRSRSRDRDRTRKRREHHLPSPTGSSSSTQSTPRNKRSPSQDHESWKRRALHPRSPSGGAGSSSTHSTPRNKERVRSRSRDQESCKRRDLRPQSPHRRARGSSSSTHSSKEHVGSRSRDRESSSRSPHQRSRSSSSPAPYRTKHSSRH